MPGDTIQFINGELLVNDKKFQEDQQKISKLLGVVIFFSRELIPS